MPRYGAMADINMTPFIDVMLVLLIIFMVAAPLLTVGVPSTCRRRKPPRSTSTRSRCRSRSTRRARSSSPTSRSPSRTLPERLQALAKDGFDERIYVRGSKGVVYGRVAEVMSIVTTAGYKKVALVTDQEKK